MRVATVDIGTNTVLLLVAESGKDGALAVVHEGASITRLGEGVDRTHRLAARAVERTLACLEDYSRTVRELGAARIAVAGTSAMRDAEGGEELRRRIQNLFGVEARVLSGDEEARLTFRGALSGLGLAERGDVGVFDIGGGSTEVVVGRIDQDVPHISFARSFDVGSVRLTERHGEDRAALDAAARTAFATVPALPAGHAPVGIAGTMTTLAAVSLELEPYVGEAVHGHVIARDDLARVLDRLASLDVATRQRTRGMEPKRADVIIAGGCLALSLLDHWSADEVMVSDRGVRWGLAEELVREGP
jgi:exopolyphosphatase/guanosine-5'-triphosphate,3'-diphosphate pyrophosphatase